MQKMQNIDKNTIRFGTENLFIKVSVKTKKGSD